MRKIVENYKERFGWIPQIGIVFCGGWAVITVRREGFSPEGHCDVSYGPFFWLRLAFGCSKAFRRIKSRGENG